MTAREICTLQFGHYANFIGAHWWNTQEFSFSTNNSSDINNRVLYREGLTLKGQHTYTPRLLLVDLNGSLNSLAEHGELYDTSTNPSDVDVPWNENVVTIEKKSKKVKNEFLQDLHSSPSIVHKKIYNFEESVKVWSDCLYTRYHPRTINIIKQHEHESEINKFDNFTEGKNVWKTPQFEDEFSDKIRNFVEECDNMQGFHVILDATNGFSGLSTQCIEQLKDDYERKSVLAIPVLPSYYTDYAYQTEEEERKSQINDCKRVINLAMSFVDMSESTSLFIPLCVNKNGWKHPGPKRKFNHIRYNDKLMYHTSAILAAALDTFTLKYRLRNTTYSLSDLCSDLNVHSKTAAAASLCLPFSFNEGAYLIDCLNNWDGPLSQSITPNCEIGTDRMMQLITLRGISEEHLKKPLAMAGNQTDMPAYKCENINKMLSFYMSCTTFGTATNVTNISKGLSLGKPFPNFFDPFVSVDGNIRAVPRKENEYVQSVPILSGLHSSTETGNMVESLYTEVKKLKIDRFHQYFTAGLEKDEYNEYLDKLYDFRDCYQDNPFL